MIQTFLCSKLNHNQSEIIAVCGNLCCLNTRLMCQQCIDNKDHNNDIDYNQVNIIKIETLQRMFDDFMIQHLEYIESQILCCLIESKNIFLLLKQHLYKTLEEFALQLQTVKDLRELAVSSSNLKFTDWFSEISKQNSLHKFLQTIQEEVNRVFDKSQFLGDVVFEQFDMKQNGFTKEIGEVVDQQIQQLEGEINQNKIFKKLLKEDSTAIEFEFLLNQVQVQVDNQHLLKNIQYSIKNLSIIKDADYYYLLAYCSYLEHDTKQAKEYLRMINQGYPDYKKTFYILGMIEMEENNYQQAIENFVQSCDILYPQFRETLIYLCQLKISSKNLRDEKFDQYMNRPILMINSYFFQQNFEYRKCFDLLFLALTLYSDDFSCTQQICQAYIFFQEYNNALKILEPYEKQDNMYQTHALKAKIYQKWKIMQKLLNVQIKRIPQVYQNSNFLNSEVIQIKLKKGRLEGLDSALTDQQNILKDEQ